MKVWGVVGWKNAGKTGLVERLVAAFTSGGVAVSTIKHTHHAVDLDRPGTDSYRHRIAGAQEVMLASDARVALMREVGTSGPPTLDDLLWRLVPVDLVLVEGFKTARHPKIEVWREAVAAPPIALGDATVRALAADGGIELDGRPVFHLDDTAAIARFIAAELSL